VQVARAAPVGEAAGQLNAVLTVVIPVFNGVDHIDRCIESVQGPGVEVVVVDDGSTDGTADHVERRWPDVLVIRQSNGGPSAARNVGAKAGTGDWIAFLDADDRALPGWVVALTSGGPGHGIVTVASRLLTEESRVDNPPGWVPQRAEGADVSFLAGTFAVRQDLFEAVGGYDEAMFFGENTELGMKVRDECDRRGLGLERVDTVLIEHVRAGDAVTRSRSYAARRAAAARRILHVHSERFRHDPAARRTHWRIIAVAERQQGHLFRFGIAAARAGLARWR
jgi:glycosyltransferase involved in cell wall biosynthesis